MKRCYYFVAKYVKNGITRTCTGTQETIDGYFDFVSAEILKHRKIKVN